MAIGLLAQHVVTASGGGIMVERMRIGAIVLDVQSAFLDEPRLQLSRREVQARFDLDETSCRAVLGLLADSRVLCMTDSGRYVRFFPHAAAGWLPTDTRRSADRPRGTQTQAA
jgi:hypothetical protein